MSLPIKENDVVLGLWYDVFVDENGEKIHCICPYDKCKSYQDALLYYLVKLHNVNRKIICIQHHGYSKEFFMAA
jgi:hypothetical protein